jgi:hypothetical protein
VAAGMSALRERECVIAKSAMPRQQDKSASSNTAFRRIA